MDEVSVEVDVALQPCKKRWCREQVASADKPKATERARAQITNNKC